MLRNILSAVAIGAGLIAASSVGASAAIVCQGHTCWHTREAFNYPRGSGIVVHKDNWKAGPHEKFTFKEHGGRGYWRGGKWVAW